MVYITNRAATSTLQDMTPIEALNRCLLGDKAKRPLMGHLKVLGCKAYVQIPKERRTKSDKLGIRAVEGTLVGFEGDHIYRVYILGRRGIVRTSTARFDESELGDIEVPDDISDLYEPDQVEDPSAELLDSVFEPRGVDAVSDDSDDEYINQQFA